MNLSTGAVVASGTVTRTIPAAELGDRFGVRGLYNQWDIRASDFALFDWAFTGDGALGEDVGNHIPDAVFDLFWPAERMPELAHTCIANYLDGLHDAGWRGDPDQVRLAVMASGVKYAWLLPGLLGRASDTSHRAYHQRADSNHLFHQRGQALAFVADGCAEALSRARR